MTHVSLTKILRVYVTACWTFFIFKLLTLPMPPSPTDGLQITYADKLVHFFIFGLLSYFLARTLELFFDNHHRTVLVASLVLPAFYGLLLEFLQANVPGRSPSLLDSAAGLSGSLFAIWVYHFTHRKVKPKLLLHICCGGCGAYISQVLKQDFKPTLFFYNPNLDSQTEYEHRLLEAEKVAKKFGLKIIDGGYDHQGWLLKIRGHEHEPERGARCIICYRERLAATAKQAREKGFVWFASTLTTSPHKLAAAISQIGRELEPEYQVRFLDRDFKKNDGFKKSIALSKELDLYRQDYCGCEFSRRVTRNA